MTTYLDKAQFRTALTNFHEETVTSVHLGGSILIRELTALQRMMAQDAAQPAEEGGVPDNYLYKAMLLQMAIVDPASGEPYSDGRRHPQTGELVIDPRTRAPLFTAEESFEFMEGREVLIEGVLQRIVNLSRLLPTDFHRGNPQANGSEQHAGSGVDTAGADAANDGGDEGRAIDLGASHDGDDGESAGQSA